MAWTAIAFAIGSAAFKAWGRKKMSDYEKAVRQVQQQYLHRDIQRLDAQHLTRMEFLGKRQDLVQEMNEKLLERWQEQRADLAQYTRDTNAGFTREEALADQRLTGEGALAEARRDQDQSYAVANRDIAQGRAESNMRYASALSQKYQDQLDSATSYTEAQSGFAAQRRDIQQGLLGQEFGRRRSALGMQLETARTNEAAYGEQAGRLANQASKIGLQADYDVDKLARNTKLRIDLYGVQRDETLSEAERVRMQAQMSMAEGEILRTRGATQRGLAGRTLAADLQEGGILRTRGRIAQEIAMETREAAEFDLVQTLGDMQVKSAGRGFAVSSRSVAQRRSQYERQATRRADTAFKGALAQAEEFKARADLGDVRAGIRYDRSVVEADELGARADISDLQAELYNNKASSMVDFQMARYDMNVSALEAEQLATTSHIRETAALDKGMVDSQRREVNFRRELEAYKANAFGEQMSNLGVEEQLRAAGIDLERDNRLNDLNYNLERMGHQTEMNQLGTTRMEEAAGFDYQRAAADFDQQQFNANFGYDSAMFASKQRYDEGMASIDARRTASNFGISNREHSLYYQSLDRHHRYQTQMGDINARGYELTHSYRTQRTNYEEAMDISFLGGDLSRVNLMAGLGDTLGDIANIAASWPREDD